MIKWNEVTWYSKLLAIIFFVGLLPVLCFYLGSRYGEVKEQVERVEPVVFVPQKKVADSVDTSEWKTYRNEEYGFEFKYPADYQLAGEGLKNYYLPRNVDTGISIALYPDTSGWHNAADGACSRTNPDVFANEKQFIALGTSTEDYFSNAGVHKVVVTSNNLKGFYSIRTCQGLYESEEEPAGTSVVADFFSDNKAVSLHFKFPFNEDRKIKIRDINLVARQLLVGAYLGPEQEHLSTFETVLSTFKFASK